MNGNICRFVPRQTGGENVNILYFVLETEPQAYPGMRVSSFYTMHFALEGEAAFHTSARSYRIRPGDIFFCIPAAPYAIESDGEFKYIYVSYLGQRANAIMDKLRINAANCVFNGFANLRDMWLSGLEVSPEMVALRSESILMYTFSEIGKSMFPREEMQKRDSDAILRIKKYVDENFFNPDLSLEKLAREFSYNAKYVSTLFKNTFKINFSEYLNIIRIQHACALMEQNFTCVKDIAALCGFKDPMYFSRVFKKRLGISPRRHCEELK